MKEKLIELINENPDLDVVIMASTDDLTDEWGYILQNISKIEVADIYRSPYEERLYFEKQDVEEKLENELCDREDYARLSDEEICQLCEEKASEYFYKRAIVIWTESEE